MLCLRLGVPFPEYFIFLSATGHRTADGFGEIWWKNLYPGIDAVYETDSGHLKSTFIVRAGGNPSRIQIQIAGHRSITLGPGGELIIDAANGKLIEQAPEVFQYIGDRQLTIPAQFRIDDDCVTFDIAPWDTAHDLIIDPVILLSSRMGGTRADIATAIATDKHGYIYVAGYRDSTSLPTTVSPGKPGGVDAFVTKWEPGAKALVYCAWTSSRIQDVTSTSFRLIVALGASSYTLQVINTDGTQSGMFSFILR